MIMMGTSNVANAEMTELGDKVEKGDNYFTYQETTDYFPVLRYNEDYVPFGDSASFCINLQWIKHDMKRMYDMYKQVQNFPICKNALNPKIRWQANDPRNGQDFKVWNQETTDVASESECSSKGGIFRGKKVKKGEDTGAGKCYVYMVVKRVCLMIAFKLHPETASYAWEYRGGCYGSGEIAVYEKAVPGQVYRFSEVPIEVREDESLYVEFGNASSAISSSLSPVFHIISSIFLFLALVFGILFAVFFFKAVKASGTGSSMDHKEQIDTD
jgi:hypothetical protein